MTTGRPRIPGREDVVISLRLRADDPQMQRVLALMEAEGSRVAVFRQMVRVYLAWQDGLLSGLDADEGGVWIEAEDGPGDEDVNIEDVFGF